VARKKLERVSITAAIRWLMSGGHSLHVARKRLDGWVHDNSVRIYRDGELIDPDELEEGGWHVRCKLAADGRAICNMLSNAPQRVQIVEQYEDDDGTPMVRIVPLTQPVWEVETSELERLGRKDLEAPGKQADNPQPLPDRRGRPPEHAWHDIDGEIARRCINPKTGRVEVPKVEAKLVDAMLTWCQQKYDKAPVSSEMAEAVRRICAALRTLQK
jgi:hypothetical protein